MTKDQEWELWAQDWRATAEPTPQLTGRVRRETRRMWLGVAAEVLAAVALAAFYAYQLAQRPPAVIWWAAAGTGVFGVVWLVHLFRTLRGTWRAEAQTTAGFLALSRERRLSQLRWFAFVRRSLVALALGILAWAPFRLHASWDMYVAEPWRAVVGFGVIIVVLAWLRFDVRRREACARRELEALESLEQETQR